MSKHSDLSNLNLEVRRIINSIEAEIPTQVIGDVKTEDRREQSRLVAAALRNEWTGFYIRLRDAVLSGSGQGSDN